MKPVLAVLRGHRQPGPPVWLMRQAGRYLPEYRELRATKGGFLDLVGDSEAAAEVTMQPIRRFGFDAAILFSDILVIPQALGQHLRFEPGEGPRLTPRLETAGAIAALENTEGASLDAIYTTVKRVATMLPPRTALLGFAGSPWTVATYMIAGEGSRDQATARALAYDDPAAMQTLVARIEAATLDYLAGQIAAGVEAVQLFDSWSGSLSPSEFERWVIAPTARIVTALRERAPDTPIIGFPKGAGGKLAAFARETGVDCIGLDETVDPRWANGELPEGMPVQGNLDPLALVAGGERLDREIAEILDALADRPHIFNLGHGIQKHTAIAHVERLMMQLRGGKP